MPDKPIRLGIVGAGNNTRVKHIPGFKAISGVQLISVANRTRESSERVAREFEIPKVYDNWLDLVQSDEIDAICIGTWPYMHAPVTIAALEAGKHVLTEARMAMNAREAHQMLEASRRRPHLIAQVVPAPHTLIVDSTIQERIASGYVGEVLCVELRSQQPSFMDRDSPLHWRQNFDLSGFNTMMMGIWYEAMMRWVGPATKVTALTRTYVNQRKDENGVLRAVTIPDHVEIIMDLASGGLAHMRHSAVTGFPPTNEVWIYGSEGSLRLDLSALKLYSGRRGDKTLSEISIPKEKQIGWRVEQEFTNAIRGKEKVARTSFEDGVKYMEWTEAVIRSAQTGQAMSLPLLL